MKKKPAVSVLMPAYNAEKYIGEAIESILKQTFKDFEFIILDDASTDNTWKVIQKYAKKDRRIITLKSKKNLYIAKARNKLLKKVRGKYIIWQDADDVAMLFRIKDQYKFMENNPKVGICGGYLQFINERGKKISVRKYAPDNDTIKKNVFKFAPVAQPAAIVRKKCFQNVGYFNPKYAPSDDLDMNFKIGKKYEFANLKKVLIRYRQNTNSATFSNLRKMELLTIEIRKKYAKDRYYGPMPLLDQIYNLLQEISVYILPNRIKIFLFNLIRNKK